MDLQLAAVPDGLAALLARERVVVVGQVALKDRRVVVHPVALRARMLAIPRKETEKLDTNSVIGNFN